MKRRLGVLNSEVNAYGTVVPDLGDLLDQTHKTIKMANTDGQTFITKVEDPCRERQTRVRCPLLRVQLRVRVRVHVRCAVLCPACRY